MNIHYNMEEKIYCVYNLFIFFGGGGLQKKVRNQKVSGKVRNQAEQPNNHIAEPLRSTVAKKNMQYTSTHLM